MSLGDGLLQALAEIPLGSALLAVAGLAFLAGIAVVWLGARRGVAVRRARDGGAIARLTPWPELLGAVAVLAVPALAAASIAISRGGFASALSVADPSDKATRLATAISGQLSTVALIGPLAVLPLVLAAIGLSITVAHRCRLRGLATSAELRARGSLDEARAWSEHPGPGVDAILPSVLGTALALSFLLFSAGGWSNELSSAFAAVAGADPAEKARLLLSALDEARPILARGPLVAAVLLALSAAAATLQLVLFSAARRRRRVAPALPSGPHVSGTALLVGAGSCLLVAGACFALAAPYRAENRDPLPARPEAPAFLLDEKIPAPDLTGPEPAERGPLLAMGARVELDGAAIAGAPELQEQLEIRKQNYLLTHPDSRFPGVLALHADRRLKLARLLPLLAAARRAGYSRISLVFGKVRWLERPLLGRLAVRSATSAALELVEEPGPPGVIHVRVNAGGTASPGGAANIPRLLALDPGASYHDLAATVVAARRAARRVLLPLPH